MTTGNAPLTVATYNIRAAIGPGEPFPSSWWRHVRPERLERIAAVIGALDADVVTLQEVAVVNVDGVLMDQPAQLARLTGSEVRYAAAGHFAIVDPESGRVVGTSLWGNAVLARVPIVEVPAPADADSEDAEALHVQVIEALEAAPASPDLQDVAALAASHVAAYEALREKIQVHIAPPTASERNCVIDLHMHTSHSWDCATDPEALLHVARQVGLTAVAVTDHNEISGALACAELAEEYDIQVIVGEEVKTAQGEVIGLFLTERIEPGLSWHETIERIRAQDGLVYVPHPFDRLHTIPDVHLLRDTLDEIDAFETYNARLAFEQYNRDAERFARKYNLIEGAGSDAHVVQGLGTAAVHMPAWDDRESFLVALGQGEILKRPKSLLYLQGLKWVNDLTGRSKKLPAEAVGREDRPDVD